MLTVTLVATLAVAALWQQWRSVEVEAAERSRVQSAWVLTGALDWARLILREDARAGGADYLSEPWSVPLQEARLTTFLAADRNNTSDTDAAGMQEAFLSGQITDLQSRMNLLNLIDNGKLSEVEMLAFGKLFELLGLPPQQLATLADNLRLASIDPRTDASIGPFAPLLPQQLEQTAWLGLPRATAVALSPFVTVLPIRTPVNLNTAPPEVIYAMIPALEMADAQRLVRSRGESHLRTLTDANELVLALQGQLSDTRHSVVSRFFEVRGRLRLDQLVVEERSVLQRDGLEVKTLWRERGAIDLRGVAPPPQR
jgi:general secretion pathway protein K